MCSYNHTEFILVGFLLGPVTQSAVFLVFFFIYLISLISNLSIITAIWLNHQLHIPMYFFLSSLAFLDICFISSTVPKLLTILVSDNRAISLTACIIQLYFYMSFGTIEFCLLAVMSVDRYTAICQPLRYHSIITSRFCFCCIFSSWVSGLFAFTYPIFLLFNLSFCGPYEINHFFCDSSAIVKISCSDTRFFDIVFSTFASMIVVGSFMITFVSYINILFTIMKITSLSGKNRAFSTCTSHFIAVSLAYGSVMFLYVRPMESSITNLNKVVAILNSIFAPVLHPFIYSMRNEQIKKIFRYAIKYIFG